jgi:hypothetical protein
MENQSQDEIKIEDTIWGTHRLRQGSNETATGRYIDVQPVINKLNDYTDNAEWIHNELSKFVLVWCANNSETEYRYHRSYGRGFIIESPDVLLERYEKAREKQSNWTILDKLLKEYILSKYKSDPVMMNKMVKKAMVEPFVHLSIDVVNNIFGTEEAQRKEMFGDFWEQADKGRNVQELKSDFNNYVEEQQQLKGVDEVTKLRKTLNQLSPLVATKVLDELASNEVRSIVNKDGDKPIDQSE